MRHDEIARVATEQPDLMLVCKTLIDRANENGGPDNITVIAARFDGEGLSQPATGDAVGYRNYPLKGDSGQVEAVTRPDELYSKTTEETAVPTRRITKVLGTTKEIVPPHAAAFTLPSVEVSPTRRIRGSLIALGLLIVLLAGAMWWVYSAASSVVAPRHNGTVTPADARP